MPSALTHETQESLLSKLDQAKGICELAARYESEAGVLPDDNVVNALEAAQELIAHVRNELSSLPT